MPKPPTTSVSLLNAISGDSASRRWGEFYRAYESPMRAYLQSHFPSLDADDVIQETLIALARCLPGYRYVPDAKGHFRNYLTGILRHKALDAMRRRQREAGHVERYRENAAPDRIADEWRRETMEAALEQLMADPDVDPRYKSVFRAVALDRENPADVARRLGITRNYVDQIKSRMTARLSRLVHAMLDHSP